MIIIPRTGRVVWATNTWAVGLARRCRRWFDPCSRSFSVSKSQQIFPLLKSRGIWTCPWDSDAGKPAKMTIYGQRRTFLDARVNDTIFWAGLLLGILSHLLWKIELKTEKKWGMHRWNCSEHRLLEEKISNGQFYVHSCAANQCN